MIPLLRPLRQRPVALLWSGLALSAIGDQAYVVAFAWIAVEAFGAAAGWLVALGPLALLLALVFGGQQADRWAPLRAMIGADLLRAVILLGVVVVWPATGAPSASALVAAVVALAIGQAVFGPALRAVIPRLVDDPRSRPPANALLDATERIARLVGPALVGVLAVVLPIRHMLTFDAATFAISASALWAVERRHPVSATLPRVGSILASMAHGFRTVRRHRLLGYVLVTSGPINGAWYAVFFLLLPLMIARNELVGPGGTGIAAYGLVISAYGFTNLLATLVVGSRPMPVRPGRQIFLGNVLLGCGMSALAVIEAAGLPHSALLASYALAAACSAVGGPMQDIPKAVLLQTELPRADIQAATRAFMAVSQLGLLLALLIAPALVAVLPLPAVIGLAGASVIGLGLIGMRRYA